MALSFAKLKSAGLPKVVAKFKKLVGDRKTSSFSFKKPSDLKGKTPKSFDFSKFTKAPKLPKAAKIAVVKKAVKKAKEAKGF